MSVAKVACFARRCLWQRGGGDAHDETDISTARQSSQLIRKRKVYKLTNILPQRALPKELAGARLIAALPLPPNSPGEGAGSTRAEPV